MKFHSAVFRAKVNAKHYVESMITEERKSLLPSDFISQQDGAPAHTAKLPQTALNLLAKTNRHPTRRTLTLLIIRSGEFCLKTTRHLIASQRTHGLKSLAVNIGPIATELNQRGHILSFTKTTSLCESWGGQFEHVVRQTSVMTTAGDKARHSYETVINFKDQRC